MDRVYKLERIPKDNDTMAELLDEIAPFMQAAYPQSHVDLHGELSFDLPLWLQMWEMQSGFFVTCRVGDALVGVAMCVKYRPLWYDKVRIDIDRTVSNDPSFGVGIEQYLVGLMGMLGVQEIYRVVYDGSTERKELVYGSGN